MAHTDPIPALTQATVLVDLAYAAAAEAVAIAETDDINPAVRAAVLHVLRAITSANAPSADIILAEYMAGTR